MSEKITISAVSPKTETFETTYGPIIKYWVRLEGYGDENFELNRKPKSDAPVAGDSFAAEIVENSGGYPRKIKRVYSKGGSSMSESKDELIVRQVAIKAAVELATAKIASGESIVAGNVIDDAEKFVGFCMAKEAESEDKSDDDIPF